MCSACDQRLSPRSAAQGARDYGTLLKYSILKVSIQPGLVKKQPVWRKKRDNECMSRRRSFLLGLLVIAVGVMVAYFIWPGVGLEYLGIIYALPVFVVNGWEWLEEPEFMEKLVEIFGKKKEKDNDRGAGFGSLL